MGIAGTIRFTHDVLSSGNSMKSQINHQFLQVSHFDSTSIQALYPGLHAIQLESGPVAGWVHTSRLDRLQINAGSLNRATL